MIVKYYDPFKREEVDIQIGMYKEIFIAGLKVDRTIIGFKEMDDIVKTLIAEYEINCFGWLDESSEGGECGQIPCIHYLVIKGKTKNEVKKGISIVEKLFLEDGAIALNAFLQNGEIAMRLYQ
jgi:hypothetical protein